jgi:hypothetical protein
MWPSNRPSSARRKRRYNLPRIKATWPYTVQEVAELLCVHKNAVLRWLNDGLTEDRSQRPFLIRGTELREIVVQWVRCLTTEKLFGPIDPLFPKTLVQPNADHSFGRDHWADATPVRGILKAAFARVGLPYFKPHTVRDTLTQLAYQRKLNPEELKARSQNMGHSSVLTTLQGYGYVSVERQGEILASLLHAPVQVDAATEIAAKVAELLKQGE